MHPTNLERIRELVAAAQDARKPHSYARHFESFSATSPAKQRILASYEQDLQALDDATWRTLKTAAIKRLMRNKAKSWEPLFDLLGEAKAYAYLRGLGCTDIQMIPPSYDYKTPDLKADLNGRVVLCEVKTLNMSDDARIVRDPDTSSQASGMLSEDFLTGKLTWTLRAAKAQLDAFPPLNARRIIYLIFNPDESLNEYVDDYSVQLGKFLRNFPRGNVEVEIFQGFTGSDCVTLNGI